MVDQCALLADLFSVHEKSEIRTVFLGHATIVEFHEETVATDLEIKGHGQHPSSEEDRVHLVAFGDVHIGFKAEEGSDQCPHKNQEHAQMNQIDTEVGITALLSEKEECAPRSGPFQPCHTTF